MKFGDKMDRRSHVLETEYVNLTVSERDALDLLATALRTRAALSDEHVIHLLVSVTGTLEAARVAAVSDREARRLEGRQAEFDFDAMDAGALVQ